MVKLKDEIKNYYESKNLSNQNLTSLQEKLGQKKNLNLIKKLSLTAATLIFIFISFKLYYNKPLEELIAREITLNHLKNMPIHIKTNKMAQIQKGLDRLNFKLIESKIFDSNSWVIKGARYCKIQGNLAAQIQLYNINDKKRYTLYQSLFKDNITPIEIIIESTNVQIWKEKDIIFGLAVSMP